jgi:hypothetical protein
MHAVNKKRVVIIFLEKIFVMFRLLQKYYRTHHAQGLKHSLSLLFLIV